MDFMSDNFKNSITGNTEKAYIVIYDNSNCEARAEDRKTLGPGDGQGLLSAASGPPPAKKIFAVQFNPGTLNIQAMSGNHYAKNNYSQSGPDMRYASFGSYIQMNVKLIFDSAGLNLNVDTSGGFVRGRTEGFLAALDGSMTRKMEFHWGKMSYEGVLNMANVEYAMFNAHGEPIRAMVEIGMVCVDKQISKENMGYWQNAYKKVFGSGTKTDLASPAQKIGGLLNINL